MNKRIIFTIFAFIFSSSIIAQKKTTLFDLVRKLIPDSSEFVTSGDWSVGKPTKFPVTWESDRLDMSDDIKINFFRNGKSLVLVNNLLIDGNGKNTGWQVMLKGARMGYTSFSITSPFDKRLTSKENIDSLLGGKLYMASLLKTCDVKNSAFSFYKFQLKGKNTAYLKILSKCNPSGCMVQLDFYDEWSKQYAELDCR